MTLGRGTLISIVRVRVGSPVGLLQGRRRTEPYERVIEVEKGPYDRTG